MRTRSQTARKEDLDDQNLETAGIGGDVEKKANARRLTPAPSGDEKSPRTNKESKTPNTPKRGTAAIKAELEALKKSTTVAVPLVTRSVDRGQTQSRKTKQSQAPLPLKCSQLLEMFKHLQMVYRIRTAKNSFLTFADAKESIQKATRKGFSIRDLAKMKFMIPEIIQWQYLEANDETPTSSRLVISLVNPNNKRESHLDDLELYNELRDCLARHARRAAAIRAENDDLPEADLPDPSTAVLVSSSRSLSSRNWSNSLSGYVSKSPSKSTSSRKTKSLTPSKRSVLSPSLVTPRRLTTVTEKTVESTGEASSNPQTTPTRRPQSSIFSPCSDNRDVYRESFKRRMLMSPSKVKERERNHAMANLVEAFRDVNSIFHRFKTLKRPLKDVVKAMRTNTKTKYSEERAHVHLQLLLEHAPQFIKLEAGTTKDKDILSIDKQCDMTEIKSMLKEISENRPKIEVDEAALDAKMKILDSLDIV
eukprot:g8707.t1